MGIYKFGLKMLIADFEQCIFYLVSVIFSVAVIFNALNIMNNNNIVLLKGYESQVCTIILFGLMIMLMLFIIFANSYFVNGKKKEMAFETLSGASLNKLLGLLFFQNFIIGIVGTLFGLLLGIAITPIFLTIMYKMLGINGSVWSFSSMSFYGTMGIMGIQFFFISFGDLMHVSSKEIKELFSERKQVYEPDTRVLKVPKVTFLIVYLIPLSSLFIDNKEVDISLFAFLNIVFSYYGTQGLIRYFLPDLILKLKKRRYIGDKIKLIALSNLHYSLRKLDLLIVILSIVSVTLICIIGIFNDSPRIKVMSIGTYISIIFLIAISILYKMIIEVENRKYTFKQLTLIGYTALQVKKIIGQEMRIFYYIVIGIPLLHIMIYLFVFNKAGIMSITLMGMLLSIYVLIFGVTAIISYTIYKKLVFN